MGIHSLVRALDSVPVEMSADFSFSGSNALNTINATVFHTQLMMLEGFARKREVPSWGLKHDRIPEFAEVLSKAVKDIANMPAQEIRLTNGSSIFTGKLRLESLDFLDSEAEPLVRGADYYTGLLNFIFRKDLLGAFNGPQRKTLQSLLDSTRLGFPSLNFRTLAPGTDSKFVKWLRS